MPDYRGKRAAYGEPLVTLSWWVPLRLLRKGGAAPTLPTAIWYYWVVKKGDKRG